MCFGSPFLCVELLSYLKNCIRKNFLTSNIAIYMYQWVKKKLLIKLIN